MAVEKMVLLNLVGSLEHEHQILEQLVLCETIHLDMENQDISDHSYMVHEYECMVPQYDLPMQQDDSILEAKYTDMETKLKVVAEGIDVRLRASKKIDVKHYGIEQAERDLDVLIESIGSSLDLITIRRDRIKELEKFKENVLCFREQDLNFNQLDNLKYFGYRIGMLARENTTQIRKNYENISAVVLKIGNKDEAKEDIYLIIYPTQFEEETTRLLKSLNWVELNLPEGVLGDGSNILKELNDKIEVIQNEISVLEKATQKNKEEKEHLINRIYTRVRLEQHIIEMKKELIHGNNLFVLSAWISARDREKVEERIGNVTEKFVVITKDDHAIDKQIMPPTKLKNNWLFKPFETVVKLYGLPSYREIDPTPFLAITFCLMFGIMFGDIGQGFIYFMAGVLFYKKNEIVGGVLTRLGSFSMIFGCIYGSFFGLEKHELPWLPSLIGSPLSTENIPRILLLGVIFGVVVLTVSFVIGIVNALRRGDIEEGIFGKNGIVGYIFFMGLIFTIVCLTGIIPVPVWVPIIVMVVMLLIMVFKEPLANLIIHKKAFIHGDTSSYFVESSFEGIETILSALSNAISFIRVGAFALNHAGLFMAFLVMSQMTDNILLKLIILLLGNLLILTLEGLVVFIQGLRLQYYEMFSKYFKGDGIEYKPVRLDD
ncbi:MAG: V-type ATP synthase subunit I [Cellulosilyticaceae bacterium]